LNSVGHKSIKLKNDDGGGREAGWRRMMQVMRKAKKKWGIEARMPDG
jgi:hypothetical protein